MRTIHTAPIELLSAKPRGPFVTEPYEAGWATEALAVIYVREVRGLSHNLRLSAQISADGARWLDHPATPLLISQPGGYCLMVREFGNWLRLTGEVDGGPDDGGAAMILDIYLILKG